MSAILEAAVAATNGAGAGFCRVALAMVVQSSLLIGGLLVVDRLVLRKRARAVLRYALWLLVLVKLTLPPTLSSPVSLGRLLGVCLPTHVAARVYGARGARAPSQVRPTVPAASLALAADPSPRRATGGSRAVAPRREPAGPQSPPVPPLPARSHASPLSAGLTWQGWALLSWLCGVLGFAACVASQAVRLRRTTRAVAAPTDEHQRVLAECCGVLRLRGGVPRLGLSSQVPVPAVCGLLRPRILLPTALAQRLPPAQLRLVLLHELAHVKRRDTWVHLAQTVLQVLYWCHPLVWVANRVIREAREQAVDESVLVTTGGQAPEYSQTLLDVAAAALLRPPLGVGLLGVVESRSRLGQRIRHILAFPSPRSARLGWAQLLALAAIGIVAVPLGLGQPAAAPKPTPAVANVTPDPVTCSGMVTDAKGQPLGGATVTCYRVRVSLAASTVIGREQSVTGADGRFVFVVNRLGPGEGGRLENSFIVAWKDGLALDWAGWNPESDSDLAVSLGMPTAISGTVVGQDDRPLPNAEVLISLLVGAPPAAQCLPGFVIPERLGCRTDALGRFSIGQLPAGAAAELTASLPGYGTIHTLDTGRADTILHYQAGQADIKLALGPEATLGGVVRRADTNEPVPGLLLHLRGAEGNDWYAHIEPVRTGADGAFRFCGLRAGRYELRTDADLDASTEWSAKLQTFSLAAGQAVTNASLAVEKGGLLELTLTDTDTNTSVGGAMVYACRQGETQFLYTRSDEAGVARLRLWPGEYGIICQVWAAGYASHRETVKVAVVGGQTLRQTVRLQKQSAVTGTVRDAKGAPVAGATVAVLPSGSGNPTTSDAQGRFQATWDPNWGGKTFRLCLVARHEKRNLAAMAEVPHQEQEVELNLEPAITVTGRVTTEKGDPIRGAGVDVIYPGDGWATSLGVPGPASHTAADGRYEIRVVPAHRKFLIEATTESAGVMGMGAEERPVEINTDVAVDGRLAAPDVVLKTPDRSVSGTVLDEAGKPVAGVEVVAFGTGKTNRRATTDRKGRFTIDKVCAGAIQVQASKGLVAKSSRPHPAAAGAGMLSATLEGLLGIVTAQGGEKDLEIVLAPAMSIRPEKPRVVPNLPVPALGQGFRLDEAFYWNEFQKAESVGAGWSRRETYALPGSKNVLLGRFGNEPVTLTLTGMPEHRFVRLYFELHTLSSWYGNSAQGGPDLWEARIEDGPRLVCASFTNSTLRALQSYPLPFGLGETVRTAAGFRVRAEIPYVEGRTWGEHVVYPMCFTVPHTAAELRLEFTGIGLGKIEDGSWALDNVGVALLNENPPRELTPAQMEQAWTDLASADVAVAYPATQALVAAGDQSVAFLAGKLGWQPDPEARDRFAELVAVLAHDDRTQWDEAAGEAQSAGPRFFPLVFAAVDRRRFGPSPPPWLSELFDGWSPPKDAGPEGLREGRAAHVLELIWSPAARQALLLE